MGSRELEEQLEKRLSALHLKAKKRRRVFFIVCGGVFVGLFILVACQVTRAYRLSAMETYGAFPLVSFLLFLAVVFVIGLVVEAGENRVRETDAAIRNLYEVDG